MYWIKYFTKYILTFRSLKFNFDTNYSNSNTINSSYLFLSLYITLYLVSINSKLMRKFVFFGLKFTCFCFKFTKKRYSLRTLFALYLLTCHTYLKFFVLQKKKKVIAGAMNSSGDRFSPVTSISNKLGLHNMKGH